MNKSIHTLVLSLLAGAAFASTAPQALAHSHGDSHYGRLDAGAANVGRHIAINTNTRFINVTDGETVRFEVDGKSFTFTFAALNSRNSLDLSEIAPAGVSVPKVRVYVARSPLYIG